MSRIAAPAFVTRQPLADLPPGHRFSLYLPLWNERWGIDDGEAKRKALSACCTVGDAATRLLAALRARQQAQADAMAPERRLVVDAVAVSPFATGLGNEHPVENGFAFLTPYGLPYLAGSGVKGVLRRAMEELASEQTPGVDAALIDALFGPEDRAADGSGPPLAEDQRRRGALSFWDVYPEPAQGRLSVEVMTPHHGQYYQGKQSPHDAGQPVPIHFLALPPQSKLEFVVAYEPASMPADLRGVDWRPALESAFKYGFDWLGFGAKTAVGYGALREDEAARKQRAQEAEARRVEAAALQQQQRLAAMSPEQREAEEARVWIDAFRAQLAAERKLNKYKAGSAFDQARAEVLRRALALQSEALRREAALALRESYKFTPWPSKKERKLEVKQWLTQLDGQA